MTNETTIPIPRLERSLTNYKWEYAQTLLLHKPPGSVLLVQSMYTPPLEPVYVHNHWLIRTENGFSKHYETLLLR